MENMKVTSQRCKVLIVLLLLFLAHSTYAASSKPASVLLQEGLYAEEVEGNLDEAIQLYKEVITSSEKMEQAAAQATYRIGLCYLKKGDTEQAAKQFSELITKYPKQESLVAEAQKQLDKLKPASTLDFTPVIYLEIPYYDDSKGKAPFGIECVIDFERAKLFSLPDKFDIEKDQNEIKKWCRQNNLDAAAILDEYFVKLTEDWYGENTFTKLSNDAWDKMPPNIIENIFQGDVCTGHTQYDRLPATFAFKTMEDNMGLLQILSTTDKTIKIRYKLISEEQNAYLPDIETGGVGVVLDLASGELLEIDEENSDQEMNYYFKAINKGDLVYDYANNKGALITLRNGKCYNMKYDDKSYIISDLKILRQSELGIYEIPAPPCKLYFITKEDRRFIVDVTSFDEKGLRIKYTETGSQSSIAQTDDSDDTNESGGPEAAAKMIAPLYGMFSSAYESLMSNNDPNTAQAIIEMAMPQLDIFENLMKGTDSYQSISMGIQVMREINEALKNGEIEKAKGLLNVINTSGDQLEKMVKEEASKAQSNKTSNNSSNLETKEYTLEAISKNRNTIANMVNNTPSGIRISSFNSSPNRSLNNQNEFTTFAALKFSADERTAQQYINMFHNHESIMLLRVSEQENLLGAYERVPVDIIYNGGLVPYRKFTIRDDSWPFLDLDGKDQSSDQKDYDIAWDTKLSTFSVQSPARILEIPGADNWEEAITIARKELPNLQNSKINKILFPENTSDQTEESNPKIFIAVLTSKNNLAVVNVIRNRAGSRNSTGQTTYNGTGSIELWLEKIPQEMEPSSPVPIVISSKPENYSNNVSPDTKEISVTFNKEMIDGNFSWVKWNYTFPETTGKPSYDQTKTTCTLPVKLEPGEAYLLRINAGQYSSFMSSEKIKAQPFVFVFSTLDASGKPTPVPEEMLNFAKQINSAEPDKIYTQDFSAEITSDGILKFKNTITQKNTSESVLNTLGFRNSDIVNVTGIQDDKGRPLKFTTTHNGGQYRYNVTLNEEIVPGQAFTYTHEGTMAGQVKIVAGSKNTYSYQMVHYPSAGQPTLRIDTFLLPEGAELISTNPADMKRTEKNGRIELHNEKIIPVGGSIVTAFQYKLEK